MGKSKCEFDSTLKKTRYFDVENVNFDPVLNNGTCLLKSKHKCYLMVWSLRNYPVDAPSLPGSPYPVECTYTILDKHNYHHNSAESMSGRFMYQVNSGTPPTSNPLGIPQGEYPSLARDNNYESDYKVCLSLIDDGMEVSIRNKVKK